MILRLAKDLSLPLEAVTQTIAIIAKRRAGKSYTMRRLVEQLFKAGQQVVLTDPKGDQHGIRSSADGKAPGLPIVILGGEHGDVPLESSGGEVVAKLVVEERVSVLLDLSFFRKHEVATFMTAFLENLYRLKAREIYRTPMMLVIDEADAIAPQKPQKGDERMLGAAEDIVRRGGQRGIGCVLVTQRSAVLNKNVLTQAQMLVALRTIAPQDLAAMNAWVDVHGTIEQKKTLMESLPSLPIGDAWFWSPGWPTAEGIFKRVHVLPIETFDSGATPKSGVKPIEPKRAADVDLDVLKRQMAATIEKAKAEDPRELRKQIAEKDKQIKQLEAEVAKPSRNMPGNIPAKEKPVLTDADRTLLEKLADRLNAMVMGMADNRQPLINKTVAALSTMLTNFEADAGDMVLVAEKAFLQFLDAKGLQKILHKLEGVSPVQAPGQGVPTRSLVTNTDKSGGPSVPPSRVHTGGSRNGSRPVAEGVSKAEQRVLDAVAWWRAAGVTEPTRHQVAFVARYTVNGHFNNMVGALRTKDLVDYPAAGGVMLTDAGMKAANPADEATTREALIDMVLAVLRTESLRKIFSAVVQADCDMTREELADLTNYTVNGHFNNMVGSLRSLGVIDYPRQGGVRLAVLFEALQ